VARTIDWDEGAVLIIDQTLLPHEERILRLTEVSELAEAIKSLRVRGAPALGVAGALGLALAARRAQERRENISAAVKSAAEILIATRPTAANLRWGVDQVLAQMKHGSGAIIDRARALLEADVRINQQMAQRGARFLQASGLERRLRLLTHCNTGALACVDWGTALGVVRAAYDQGAVDLVYVTETRPLLQGARLTTWELGKLDIPYRVVVDSAAASLIARGRVDAVLVGADRVAGNGDVANKIGTYPLALAAKRSSVPFIVVAPESSLDPAAPRGDVIPIEQRAESEVLEVAGVRVAPAEARAENPAFDVTPADLVTAIITEDRVIRPAQERLHARAVSG
jgi:S-methyl-5-thioribose-1-phosphate isomerase